MPAAAGRPAGSAVSTVGDSAKVRAGRVRSVCSTASPRRTSSRMLSVPCAPSLFFQLASAAVSAIASTASSGQPTSLSMRRSSWSLFVAAQKPAPPVPPWPKRRRYTARKRGGRTKTTLDMMSIHCNHRRDQRERDAP